jgi:serine/threonine protein phosphatase PrpC
MDLALMIFYVVSDPHKENQDAYSINHNFASQDGDSLFAVYDGHGNRGHDCAMFAKKVLPNSIAKYVRQKRLKLYQEQLKQAGKPLKGSFNPAMWPKLSVEDYERACRKGFLECNEKMHQKTTVSLKIKIQKM